MNIGKSRKNRIARSGFTLIEMVVVLVILVILAGLVVAKLDVFEMKANKGVSASNMAGISRYVQTYRILTTQYPDRWDSLLGPGGTLIAPGAPGTTPGLDPQLVGGPPAGSPNKLTTTTLSETATVHEVRSLARMGVTTVFDFPAVASWNDVPGNMANVSRTLADGGTVATLRVQPYVAAGAEDGDALSILNHIYPSPTPIVSVPAGKKLIVVGLGRLNMLIGNTNQNGLLTDAPFYANTNQVQYYNRFLVVFECDSGGARARQVAVLGGDGDQLVEEVADFYQQTP